VHKTLIVVAGFERLLDYMSKKYRFSISLVIKAHTGHGIKSQPGTEGR